MEAKEREDTLKFMGQHGVEETTVETKDGFMTLSGFLMEHEKHLYKEIEKYRVASYDWGYRQGYSDGEQGKPMRKDLGN